MGNSESGFSFPSSELDGKKERMYSFFCAIEKAVRSLVGTTKFTKSEEKKHMSIDVSGNYPMFSVFWIKGKPITSRGSKTLKIDMRDVAEGIESMKKEEKSVYEELYKKGIEVTVLKGKGIFGVNSRVKNFLAGLPQKGVTVKKEELYGGKEKKKKKKEVFHVVGPIGGTPVRSLTNNRLLFLPSSGRHSVADCLSNICYLSTYGNVFVVTRYCEAEKYYLSLKNFVEMLKDAGFKFKYGIYLGVLDKLGNFLGAGYVRNRIVEFLKKTDVQSVWMLDDSIKGFMMKNPEGDLRDLEEVSFSLNDEELFEKFLATCEWLLKHFKLPQIGTFVRERGQNDWFTVDLASIRPIQGVMLLNMDVVKEIDVNFTEELHSYEDMIFSAECYKKGKYPVKLLCVKSFDNTTEDVGGGTYYYKKDIIPRNRFGGKYYKAYLEYVKKNRLKNSMESVLKRIEEFKEKINKNKKKQRKRKAKYKKKEEDESEEGEAESEEELKKKMKVKMDQKKKKKRKKRKKKKKKEEKTEVSNSDCDDDCSSTSDEKNGESDTSDED